MSHLKKPLEEKNLLEVMEISSSHGATWQCARSGWIYIFVALLVKKACFNTEVKKNKKIHTAFITFFK